MIVVSDTSPINYLIRVSEPLLLKKLFGHVIIPPAVFDELNVRLNNRQDIADFLKDGWMSVVAPQTIISQPLRYALDKGEWEALSLAIELKANYLIIDERQGAAAAKDFHVPVVGLAGVLITAKKKGLVPAVKPLLDSLIQEGFYLTERFYKNTLSQINE